MITVYSKPNCAPCAVVKHLLKAKGITYTEKDMLSNMEEFEGLSEGHLTAPLVVKNGKRVSHYDLTNMIAVLKQDDDVNDLDRGY